MKVNCKGRYSKDLQQRGLEITCMFSVSPEREKCYTDLKKMLMMSCQRNENRIRK